MNLSINPLTHVITILQADLTLLGGASYQLSTNALRIALRDWEDNVEGIWQPKTHNHNTSVLLGGIQYARVLEILSPYTITFEETGTPYTVSLSGSNNNILEKTNLGTVQILSNNSAGLINVSEVQYDSFNREITIDPLNGTDNTTYPSGTPAQPCKTIANALAIASFRGFKTINVLSPLTITTGLNVDEYVFRSDNWIEVTVQPGVSLLNTSFQKVSLYGVMGGVWNVIIDCWVYDITNLSGWVRGGSIGSVALSVGTVGLEFGGQTFLDHLAPLYPGEPSTLIMNTDTSVSFTSCADHVIVQSMTAGSTLECGLHGGRLTVDVSCTGGDIHVLGTGILVNNSALVIDTEGLNSPETVSDAVWDEATAGHTTAGTTGKALTDAGAAGNPWGSPVAGNTDPGTFGELVGNKVLTVAKFLGLK